MNRISFVILFTLEIKVQTLEITCEFFLFSISGLQSLWITTVCSSQLQQYKQERATNQPSIAYAQPIIGKPPPTSVSSDKLLQTPTSSETGKKIYFLDNVIYLKEKWFGTAV